MVYTEVARAVIGGLKYGDRPELAGFCARLMASAGSELWAEKPVLVPVPLAPRRRFERLYNQSTELARGLALLDVGHWASERQAALLLADGLRGRLPGVEVLESRVETQPFRVV